MPVLVSCYDEDWYWDWEKMETSFSPWECSRVNNSVVKSPTRPKFELSQGFMPVLITCKFDKDPIKGVWDNTETAFSLLYVNGSFLLPW